IGQFPLIMVAPYDNDIIHEGSEVRRRFFDMIISQFDREYLHDLISYQKVLGQRNILLKQSWENGHLDAALLQIYNDQLVPYAEAVHEKRRRFVETIIPVFQKYYDYLSESREKVDIRYLSSLSDGSFADLLSRNAESDFRAGHTTAGIHKDDYDFLMDGRSVKRYSSQGQQKSFALALKLSQFDYIYNMKRLKPILLLDDIFDKLDESRISQLLNLVGNEHFGQVFLSDTDEDRIVRILNRHGISHKIFRVEKE
ncbi:MAG: DNA replication and repair protein RecF, partial [Bacteroidales bacterium]|nr:DNA replication and repair protein RecF [Bacteroidales bacterium]